MRGDERLMEERIEAGLRSYAQPRAMPEALIAVATILERAQKSRFDRFRWGNRPWLWIAGGVATACLLIAIVSGAVWMLREPHVPEIARVPRAPSVASIPQITTPEGVHDVPGTVSRPALPEHTIGVAQGSRRERAQARVVRKEIRAAQTATEPLPKLAVFPTPRPLSPEEQALVAFATKAPQEAQQAAQAREHLGDPIVIASLRIRPLDQGENQDSGKGRE